MENQQMTSALEQFCGGGDDRPFLARPFTFGERTYATNGAILVCVPRVEAFGPPAGAPEGFEANINKILTPPKGTKFFNFPVEEIPPKPDAVECFVCRGTGHEHSCPDCQCQCHKCFGTGKIDPDNGQVIVNRVPFSADYIRWIAALPNLRMSRPQRGWRVPALFKFGENGFGALMPMQGYFPGSNQTRIKLGIAPVSKQTNG